jgi:glycosyltransferase involved in cell wall biosynthesis
MFGSNVWACIVGKLAGVPVIVCHEHMWSYGGSRFRSLVDRWLIARFSNAFVAVSEAGRRSMIESEGIPERDVVLLRNGLRSLPPGVHGRVRSELGIEPERPVVVTVGILRPEKAHSVLIEAAAELVRGGVPDLRVLIVGDGGERPHLESLIDRLGLGDAVSLLGLRRDIADILAVADLAVCCSDFEGGPLSVMEYMSAELPIVATDVGGLPELVQPDNGLLVPPRDPAALADAVLVLLRDPERRRRLGRAGRERRDREYGADVYIEHLEALYEELLGAAAW